MSDAAATVPRVFAITLNWNRWPDTLRCVASLKQQSLPGLQIIVVDNGSVDDSVAQLQRACPDVQLLCTGKNLGFGGGCNVGIRAALSQGADYIWLINNDAVAAPMACAALLKLAESAADIGQVGSAIYDLHQPETMLAWGGGYVNRWLGQAKHFAAKTSDENIHFLTAASTLISRHVWQAAGMFDESFFLYWEDVDLSFRIRAAGFKLAVASESHVLHAESSSLGKTNPLLDYYHTKSNVIFFRKHYALGSLTALLFMVARSVKKLSRGDVKKFRAVLKGYANA